MDAFRKILDDVDEVDLTPMIDVTFLLLIYFMVTTMLVQPESQLSFQLPGKPQSSDSVTPMESAKINSMSDGTITLNGSPIPVDDPYELTQYEMNGGIQFPQSLQKKSKRCVIQKKIVNLSRCGQTLNCKRKILPIN